MLQQDVTKDSIILPHLYQEMKQYCKHIHKLPVSLVDVNTVLDIYLKSNEQNNEKTEEILCAWVQQNNKQQISIITIQNILENIDMKGKKIMIVYFFLIVVRLKQKSQKILRKLQQFTHQDQIAILIEYVIQHFFPKQINHQQKENIDSLCKFMSQTKCFDNQKIRKALLFLLEDCLFKCLFASQGLITKQLTIETLKQIEKTTPYLKSKDSLDSFLQNIYLIAIESHETFISLMQWLCSCFSHPVLYLHILSGCYLLQQCSQILLKVCELFPTVQQIKHLIKSLKVLSNTSPLAETIIKQILSVNNQKIIEQHLVQLIDFDIKNLYPLIYQKILPYALKSIDKIKQNVILINYIVKIRLIAKDDWSIVIKNEVFNKFFEHICHYLTSQNLLLLYQNSTRNNETLMKILLKFNNKIFSNQEKLLKYLLPQSIIKSLNLEIIEFIIKILSQFLKRTTNKQVIMSLKKYCQEVFLFYTSIKQPKIKLTINLIQLEVYLQKQTIRKQFHAIIYQLGKEIWDKPIQQKQLTQGLNQLFTIFKQRPNKTSTLALLRFIFFKIVSTTTQLELQNFLDYLKHLIESYVYYRYHCFSKQAYDELLLIYSVQGSNQQVLTLIRQIIVKWINFTGIKQIHHLYEISKYQSSSQFLQQRIKLLKQFSQNNKCRVFFPIDKRLCNFLILFYEIISYQNLQKQSTINKRILYCCQENDVNLTYKFLQNQITSVYDILITLHRNPLKSQPLKLYIKQPNIQYEILIKQSQIQILKITKQQTKTMYSKTIQNSHTIDIKIGVDLQRQNLILDINRQQIQLVIYRTQIKSLNETTSQILEQIICASDAYIESVIVNYNTTQKFSFNMNTCNETIRKFTLNIKHLDTLSIFNGFQYFSLKYLFVFILQIAKNQLNYSLYSIDTIVPLLYKIVFYHIEYQLKSQNFGLFTFLQYVTKAIIKLASNICFQEISHNTIKLMMKVNNGMAFQYFKNIILNFEIWSNCLKTGQQIIMDTILQVIKESQSAASLIIQNISCFNEISQAIIKYYLPTSQSKTLNFQQKQQLKNKMQQILYEIVIRSHPQLFMKYVSHIIKSTLQQKQTIRGRRRSTMENKVPGNFIQKIVDFVLNKSQNQKNKYLTLLLKLKQFKVVPENLSMSTNQQVLKQILKLCQSHESLKDIYENIKIMLSSIPLMMLENSLDPIMALLQNTDKLKSQQKMMISLLSPYLYRYTAFSSQTKHKILSYLIVFYQANTIQPVQKSNFFSVRLISTPQFIQLLTNLCDQSETDYNIIDKSIKLVGMIKLNIQCMDKSNFFEFLYLYRRKCGSRIKALVFPIKSFKIQTRSIVDYSLILQYAYQCLIVFQMLKIQKDKQFFDTIYQFIQNTTTQRRQQLYCACPPIQTNINNKKVLNIGIKSFEIRGGHLFKFLLLIFQYFKMTQDERILQKLSQLLISNVQKSQDLKNFRKSKNALFNFESRSTAGINQFQVLVKRTTKNYLQKNQQLIFETGESIYNQKQGKQELASACLPYVVLKLLLQKEIIKNQQLIIVIDQFISDLSQQYSSLNQDYNPDKITSYYQTFQEQQIIKSLTEDASDLLNNLTSIKHSESPLRRTTSHRNDIVSPTKRKYSTASKPLIEIRQVEIVDQSIFIKQNTPLKSYKLLQLEFVYLYLLRSNIANISDESTTEQNHSKLLKQFKNYMQKLDEQKKYLKNQQNIHWDQFVKKVEQQDGLFYQRIHKKKPILKLRCIHLPNMIQGITQQTSDYQYDLIKQQVRSLNQKMSFLSYSFLKPQSFINKEKNSIIEWSSQTTFQQIDNDLKKLDCQWVTRRGVYFSSFSFDHNDQKIIIQTDKNGRPDSSKYIKGATKDSIIKDVTKIKQIDLDEIKQIFVRRFNQIQGNSIQIFTYNCKSYYIVFYSQRKVQNLLKSLLKYSKSLKQDQIITNCEQTFKNRKYSESWQSGKINNFDYLMLLNIYSGRSFNDPNQYPIFPWVIKDYTSKQIKFNKTETYRDLSLPIGALNPNKLERYITNSKIQNQDKQYLYGSFMSTSLFVFFYMIRIEPFSSLARQLQGGHFDTADRLFTSIAQVWRSINSQSNTSDIKQLIPQFYSLNIFLQNLNRLDFGKTQTGTIVDDVLLPPWANDSNTFISIMREALQSDFVSSKLHLWIDLVFGNHQYSKQRFNMFHPRYYEQNIDYKQIQDHQIEALIAQITYFGQFPKKLFSKNHLPKTLNIKKPLKISFIQKQDISGSVQRIKKIGDLFVIRIHQNKHFKNYTIRIPFDKTIKRIQIDKKSIPKSGELVILESKTEMLYYKSHLTSVFLKRLKIDIPFKKSIINDRMIVLCGQDLVVLNLQGKLLLNIPDVQPKTAVIFESSIAFLDKNFSLKKVSLIPPNIIQTLYQQEPYYYHCQLVGYKSSNRQGYILCFDRNRLIYISN